MKKLTKKSLEELAKTMNVIPEEEREDYWGMYKLDCYWRCVSTICSNDNSEAGAASIADYYADNHNSSYRETNLSQGYANVTDIQMDDFNAIYQVPKNSIAGFKGKDIDKYFGSSSVVNQGSHMLVNKGKNADGTYSIALRIIIHFQCQGLTLIKHNIVGNYCFSAMVFICFSLQVT